MNMPERSEAAVAPEEGGTAAEELTYRLRQQELLAQFGMFAFKCRDLDALLQEATRLCAVGLHTDLCKALRWLPAENRLLVGAGVGWAEGVVGRATIGADLESPAGYALRTGEPVLSDHLQGDTRFRTPKLLAEHGVKRAINVVVRGEGEPFGILEVDSSSEGKFTKADIAFMQGFANLLGVAIERHRADAAVQESEEQARLVVEGARDYAIFTADADGRVTTWSQGAATIFGWTADEIAGCEMAVLFVPEDRKRGVPAQELATARDKGSAADERWHLRKDGSRFFASGSVRPLHDAAGNLRGFLKVARDATKRREAEGERDRLVALEQSRAEQLTALARASTSIAATRTVRDALQEITHVARILVNAHQAVVSMSRAPGWGQSIREVSLSDKYSNWADYSAIPDGSGIYAQVCETNQPLRLTQAELEAHPRWRAFGQHREAHPPMRGWLAAPLTARDGRNLGLIQLSDKVEGDFDEGDEAVLVQLAQLASVAVERAQTEEALHESEERLRMAVGSADIGTWDLDPATGELRWDARCKALFGLPAEADVDFDTFLAGLHPEDRAATQAAVDQALDPAGPGEYDVQYRTIGLQDGETRWISARGRASLEDGKVARFVGTVLDIGDAKRAEALMRERMEQQEILTREVSHRVKNSLQLVAGLLVFQRRATKDPDVRRALADAEARIATIAQVHDHIWQQNEVETVDLAVFLRDLCAKLQETAPDHRLVYEAEAVMISSDRAVPIGLLVNELVTNAFKYAYPDGSGGEVKVALEVRDGGDLRLEVADRGVGLPEGSGPARASASLGMKLVHVFARQLKGELRVLSAGPGARFILDLPRRADHEGLEISPRNRVTAPAP